MLCAIVGALLALSGYTGLTLGTLVAFLNLNKNATQPVSQISQPTSSDVMAMAGAQRVFDLMDAPPERDEGYVELVNAKEDRNGSLVECEERTNVWAWKHPHKADGTVTYTRLQGDVDVYKRQLFLLSATVSETVFCASITQDKDVKKGTFFSFMPQNSKDGRKWTR